MLQMKQKPRPGPAVPEARLLSSALLGLARRAGSSGHSPSGFQVGPGRQRDRLEGEAEGAARALGLRFLLRHLARSREGR